jgi:hypothetical protein
MVVEMTRGGRGPALYLPRVFWATRGDHQGGPVHMQECPHHQLHRWHIKHRMCVTETPYSLRALALWFGTSMVVHHSASTAIRSKFGILHFILDSVSTSKGLHRHHQQLLEPPLPNTAFRQGVNECLTCFLQDLLHPVILSEGIVTSLAASRTWRRISPLYHVGIFLRLLDRVVLMVVLLLLSVQPQSGSRVTHR